MAVAAKVASQENALYSLATCHLPLRATGDESCKFENFSRAMSPRRPGSTTSATGALPGFKPATAEEIARRYSAADPDPGSRYYAVEDGEVVGYAAFGPNGRVSAPWCLPGAEASREPLLQTVLAAMRERGIPEAWAAYRADWSPVLDLLRGHGFLDKRQMINYVAEVAELPADAVLPTSRVIEPAGPEMIRDLNDLAPGLYPEDDPSAIDPFYPR